MNTVKQKILIIEDEAAIADTITYALSTEGFEPVWTTTGGEGLAVLGREDIAIIILDIGLPDRDGFELCREIRKTSTIPIIFLTARSDEIDRVVGLEIGGDDYVVKPFSPRELTARVKAILRRSSAPDFPSNIAEGNFPFIVDKERLRVTYFGTLLDLSRYELGIMMVLIRPAGYSHAGELWSWYGKSRTPAGSGRLTLISNPSAASSVRLSRKKSRSRLIGDWATRSGKSGEHSASYCPWFFIYYRYRLLFFYRLDP